MGDHRVYRDHKYELGNQLLILRTRIGLTQIELAEQLGVHRRSVQKWETGESYPKAEMLQRLIAALLRHGAFTAGQEREEAHALWRQAAEDGAYPLATFDEVWFARALAFQGSGIGEQGSEDKPQASSRSPIPEPRSLVDWGEAIAVPTLYGREGELETLRQWVVDDHCRLVTVVGLGGIGKSSLAITIAHQMLSQFDFVLFRSLQNAPPLAQVLDQTIRAISDQKVIPPESVPNKIAQLVQLFHQQRCLFILDNLETIMQPGALTGTYRTGYADYGALLQRLGEGDHQSCLMLTSREKPAELGPLEGRIAPVRSLLLRGVIGVGLSGVVHHGF